MPTFLPRIPVTLVAISFSSSSSLGRFLNAYWLAAPTSHPRSSAIVAFAMNETAQRTYNYPSITHHEACESYPFKLVF
jgi:hypothetical protein